MRHFPRSRPHPNPRWEILRRTFCLAQSLYYLPLRKQDICGGWGGVDLLGEQLSLRDCYCPLHTATLYKKTGCRILGNQLRTERHAIRCL